MDDLRFIIADDHPMVRAALRQTLSAAFPKLEVSEYSTFDHLAEALGDDGNRTDLLLLDLNMPGMQGFVGLHTVLANWPAVPVVVVSASEDPASIERTRLCGASGFIPKSAPMETVAAIVRAVLDGALVFGEGNVLGDSATTEDERDISRRLAMLTPQQMRVLQAILSGKLNKQIAGELDLAEQTVKGHVSQILRKLGLNSRTQVVIAVGPLIKRS